jgi:hypothetical protein
MALSPGEHSDPQDGPKNCWKKNCWICLSSEFLVEVSIGVDEVKYKTLLLFLLK